MHLWSFAWYEETFLPSNQIMGKVNQVQILAVTLWREFFYSVPYLEHILSLGFCSMSSLFNFGLWGWSVEYYPVFLQTLRLPCSGRMCWKNFGTLIYGKQYMVSWMLYWWSGRAGCYPMELCHFHCSITCMLLVLLFCCNRFNINTWQVPTHQTPCIVDTGCHF